MVAGVEVDWYEVLKGGGALAYATLVYVELRSLRALITRVLLISFPRARNASNDPDGRGQTLG